MNEREKSKKKGREEKRGREEEGKKRRYLSSLLSFHSRISSLFLHHFVSREASDGGHYFVGGLDSGTIEFPGVQGRDDSKDLLQQVEQND